MSTVGNLIAEVADMAKYLTTRKTMSGDVTALEANMVAAFCKKLAAVRQLDMANVVPLVEAVSTSNLSDATKNTIQDAIDTRFAAALAQTPSAQPGTAAHTPQKLGPMLTNYLTAADWLVLKDPKKSLQAKSQVLTDRLSKLGVRYAAEVTVRWCVALLVCMMYESTNIFPSYTSIHDMVHDFKASIDSSRVCSSWSFGHIVVYPDLPSDLPADIYANAYTDDDKPVIAHVSRLDVTAAQHIPLRKTSNLLRGQAHQHGGGGASSQAGAGYVSWDHLQRLLSGAAAGSGSPMFAGRGTSRRALSDGIGDDSPSPMGLAPKQARVATTQAHMHPAGAGAMLALPPPPSAQQLHDEQYARAEQPHNAVPVLGLPDLSGFGAKQPSGAVVLDPQLALATASSVGGAPLSTRRTSAEIEEAAYAAIQQRGAKRACKRAAAKKTKADSVKKRPASATAGSHDGALMKRPAAAIPKGRDDGLSALIANTVVWDDDLDSEMSRKNYTSKMYHRFRLAAKKELGIVVRESIPSLSKLKTRSCADLFHVLPVALANTVRLSIFDNFGFLI